MEPATYGYIRVSTKEQCEDRQILALRDFPVPERNIFMDKLSGKDFNRLKIGIGPQPPIPSENYVLQNFPKEHLEILKETLKKAEEAVFYLIDNGMEKAQNKFN